jgi:hypothetical protein
MSQSYIAACNRNLKRNKITRIVLSVGVDVLKLRCNLQNKTSVHMFGTTATQRHSQPETGVKNHTLFSTISLVRPDPDQSQPEAGVKNHHVWWPILPKVFIHYQIILLLLPCLRRVPFFRNTTFILFSYGSSNLVSHKIQERWPGKCI